MHVTQHDPTTPVVRRAEVRRIAVRRPSGMPEIETAGAPQTYLAVAGLLVVAMAAYVALAGGYAALTPLWQNPDEPAHYTYVAQVAATGGLPELKPGDWDAALLERVKHGALEPGDTVESIRYEAWQPPLFYLVAAPVLRGLAPDFHPEFRDPAGAVTRLRWLDVLLGAITLGFAYLCAREVLPVKFSPTVPLVLVGVPMFTSVSSAISADPLANLLSAVVLLVLLRRLRERRTTSRPPPDTPRWAIGTGALIGLGILTKLAVGIVVPIAVGITLLRSRRPFRDCVAMLAAVGLVVLPWLVHQVTTYGWLDPLATARHAAVVSGQPRFAGLSVDWAARLGTTTFHSFWAQFGWMAIVAPDPLYWIWGGLMLVGVVGLVRQGQWLAQPTWRVLLATLCAALIAYLGYNFNFEQFQGRYLFPALVPIACLLVAGWAAWLPPRWSAAAVALVGLGLIGLNAYALVRVLGPGFAPVA